jgi:hypothetical protein
MNIFYDTNEKANNAGLIRIGDLDEPDLTFEFHQLVVLKHEPTGRLFYAEDSGCSCPTPFEDVSFSGPEDTTMTEITVGDSFSSFRRDVERFPASQSERESLIAAVERELKCKL